MTDKKQNDLRYCVPVEYDRAEDGRWIAEVVGMPGCICYGPTKELATRSALTLAIEVLACDLNMYVIALSDPLAKSLLNAPEVEPLPDEVDAFDDDGGGWVSQEEMERELKERKGFRND